MKLYLTLSLLAITGNAFTMDHYGSMPFMPIPTPSVRSVCGGTGSIDCSVVKSPVAGKDWEETFLLIDGKTIIERRPNCIIWAGSIKVTGGKITLIQGKRINGLKIPRTTFLKTDSSREDFVRALEGVGLYESAEAKKRYDEYLSSAAYKHIKTE